MNRQRLKLGATLGAVGALGLALGFFLSARLELPSVARASGPAAHAAAPAAVTAPVAAAAPAALPPGGAFVDLSRRLGPAVVHIKVKVGGYMDPWGRQAEGQGTGFIVSPDGYIVTNDHVVGRASRILVALQDNRELEGRVVGTDPQTDVALIKIDDNAPLPAAPLGDSDTVQIGEWVMAIGNPFGLDHTVTAGIISAKGRRDISPGGRRRLDRYYDFLQTDASINPGNSGGPLINLRGEVIGINTAISAQGQGIGFAIPINMAKTLLPQLKANGKVQRSYIGVGIEAITDELMARLRLADNKGALVSGVVRGSPADKVGLKPGDVIVAFDGKPIDRHDDLPWLASMAGVGRTVPIVIAEPGGKRRELSITLEPKPER